MSPTRRRRGRGPWWVAAFALAALSLAIAGSAAAEDDTGHFWRSVREPGHARAMHLARQGLYLYEVWKQREREDAGGAFELNAILEGAIERFALAHRLSPRDPMAVYLHAIAVSKWELPGPAGGTRMDDEALALFNELRALDPAYSSMEVAFEIAVIHTRALRFAQAADEYRRAISQSIEPDSVPWSNLAEVTMLAGDLEGAVRYYERAIEIAHETGGDGTGATLALWGLAVALDRLGEHQRALEVAEDALSSVEGMSVLRKKGVFFEPAYEIHYYEGLGHAALALRADDRRTREREEAASRESFRRFVGEGGAESPWAGLAERHARSQTTPESPALRR